MHKDKPPGLFDLGSRPVGYSVGLGLITGFVLSIFASIGMTIWRADSGVGEGVARDAEALETETADRRNPSPTPVNPAEVRY